MSRAAGRPGPEISPQQSRMKMRSTALCAVLLSMAAPALQGCGGLPPGEETNEAAEEAADALLTPALDLPKPWVDAIDLRSEEHTSELQSLMRISYAVFCLKKNNTHHEKTSPLTTRSL